LDGFSDPKAPDAPIAPLNTSSAMLQNVTKDRDDGMNLPNTPPMYSPPFDQTKPFLGRQYESR
jgi:hypothetical protein